MFDIRSAQESTNLRVSECTYNAKMAIAELEIDGGFEEFLNSDFPEVVSAAKAETESLKEYANTVLEKMQHKADVLSRFCGLIGNYSDFSVEYHYYDRIVSMYFSAIGRVKDKIQEFKDMKSKLNDEVSSIYKIKNKAYEEYTFNETYRILVDELGGGEMDNDYAIRQRRNLISSDPDVELFFDFLDASLEKIGVQKEEIKKTIDDAYAFKDKLFNESAEYREKRKQVYNKLFGMKFKINNFVNRLNDEDFELLRDSLSLIFDTNGLRDSEIISDFLARIRDFTDAAIGGREIC